jgi:site-specific recombinase XerD
MFNKYFSDGIIQKPVVKYIVREFTGEIGNSITAFLSTLEEKRLSGRTIDGYERFLSYFLRHLSLRKVHHVCNISESDVLSFIASGQNSKENPLTTMRLFCRYLYEQKLIDRNIEYIIGKNSYIVKEKLPSIYDPEEIKQIESSVEQSSPVGKRDYAMLLLATRLGLRASDIAGLQFNNLDWDRNIIRLVQFKTKREIELPLLNDVGEAIINYLKFGRPHSSSQQVFLSSLPPYNPANGMVVSRAVRNIISLSKVNTRNRKTGPHSMRHTLASRLLHNGVALPVISEALGHKNTQTTMGYLRIDVDGLMKCTLDVPGVPSDFYIQKGGIFYV